MTDGVTDQLRALSQRFGVPGIDIAQAAILLAHLDVVPQAVCERQQLLPVLITDEFVFLAMVNPADRQGIAMFEFATGRKVYPYVAVADALDRTIAAAFAAKAQGQQYYLGPRVSPETLRDLGLAGPPAPKPPPPVRRDSIEIPIVVVDEAMERRRESVEMPAIEYFDEEEGEVSRVTQLPEQESALAGGKKILVVDDEAEIRMLIKRMLVAKGHRIFEADRGLLALKMVKQHTPDLIILDAMLPELHGFDIARRIRGSEKYGDVPIIMVSAVHKGWALVEDVKSTYGVQEYLEKPFKMAELLAAVERLFKAQAKRESVRPPRDPEQMSTDARACLAQGMAAYKAGNLEEAVEQLRRGVRIDPLAYRLRYQLALLYAKTKRHHDAIGELEKALELHPKQLVALRNLAVLYETAGFKRKAIETWEQCVALAPDPETRSLYQDHLAALI